MENFGTLITTLPGGQKREYALSKAEASIGRAATSVIALRDTKVSRAHGVIGALLALAIMGSPFGFMAFLGIASLIGVIVSHVPFRQAICDAGIERLRPVKWETPHDE